MTAEIPQINLLMIFSCMQVSFLNIWLLTQFSKDLLAIFVILSFIQHIYVQFSPNVLHWTSWS